MDEGLQATVADSQPQRRQSGGGGPPAGLIAGLLAVLVAVLIAAPAYLAVPSLLELQAVLGLAVFAVATNLLLGYGGLVSFGQAAFYGVGSYTIAATWLHWRVPFWLAFIGAPIVAAIAALLVGLIALRARKLDFALLTLAVSQLFNVIAEQQYNFTGGANGIFGAMIPAALVRPLWGYWFVLGITVLALLALWKITVSPFGLVLRATREKRNRADALGVNVFGHQLLAFVISGFFCGLAGALYVVHNQNAYPDLLNWVKSGDPVIMAVIGGMYTFLGPVLGAFIFYIAEQYLVTVTHDWQLILGLVLLAIILFMPDGVLGRLGGDGGGWPLLSRRRRRRGPDEPAA
ncbi:MAG: branched-chain amino acid ABC transporter permease [Acetobacteraceae bacterium]